MLSIFVMYSPDRKAQLEQMVRINSRMEGWEEADKMLLVDGTPNVEPPGFRVIEVPRPTEDFNWSRMWGTGVQEARHNTILYLDSDRVLPRDYLTKMLPLVDDNSFVFCERLYGFARPMSDDDLINLLDNYTWEDIHRQFHENRGLLYYDPRWQIPLHGPGKGAMSGNTAFTRLAYFKSGGVDPWFRGHGAYADTDFQKQVVEAGFRIVDVEGAHELHIWHAKYTDEHKEVTPREVEIMSLNNWIYHCRKWNLGYAHVRGIALYLGLGKDFVDRVLRRLDDEPFLPILG